MTNHVVVAGPLYADLVMQTEWLPGPDEEVAASASRRLPGGAAARALASLRNGTPTALVGRIGSDEAGRFLRSHLAETGLDISALDVADGATGIRQITVAASGAFTASRCPGIAFGINAVAAALPTDAAVLLVEDSLPESVILELALRARALGMETILTVFGQQAPSASVLAATDVLLTGHRAALAFTGTEFSTPRQSLEGVAKLAEQTGRAIVLFDDGAMVHGERGARPEFHPPRGGRVESRFGVADMFAGALASQRAAGSELDAAAHYAQAAASLLMTTPLERRDLIRATQIRARLGEDDA
jgi:ribokinase